VETDCKELRELTAGADPVGRERLEEHAARCPECRLQLAADRELRHAFQRLAQPALSPRFNKDLRLRLRAEREHRRLLRRSRLMMQGYWLAASVASVLVLLLTRWPTAAPSALTLGSVGAILAVALLTLAILLRLLRTDFLDLILGTMKVLRS